MIADALVHKYGYANGLVIYNGEVTKWPEEWPKQPKSLDKIVSSYEKHLKSIAYIQNRKNKYPDIGEQLDAILKWITSERFQGENLPQDLDNIIGQWTAVKKKYPKPKE